jgi:hypothetical protein
MAMIMATDHQYCSTAIQDTGSRLNPASLRNYMNGAPFLTNLGDAAGVSQLGGKT